MRVLEHRRQRAKREQFGTLVARKRKRPLQICVAVVPVHPMCRAGAEAEELRRVEYHPGLAGQSQGFVEDAHRIVRTIEIEAALGLEGEGVRHKLACARTPISIDGRAQQLKSVARIGRALDCGRDDVAPCDPVGKFMLLSLCPRLVDGRGAAGEFAGCQQAQGIDQVTQAIAQMESLTGTDITVPGNTDVPPSPQVQANKEM